MNGSLSTSRAYERKRKTTMREDSKRAFPGEDAASSNMLIVHGVYEIQAAKIGEDGKGNVYITKGTSIDIRHFAIREMMRVQDRCENFH